ncbi:MAG: cell wall hydrolase [Deltaproteobacteria bacterium]|nr:cell wall hydrolase [Deltaproteobacteria bacterium]
MSFASASPSVTVSIPRGDIAAMRPTASLAYKTAASPVAELAAVGRLDAVELAMEPPRGGMKFEPRIAAASAPAATQPIKLASLDPGSLPTASITPQPTPVSLPMSNAMIPLDMVPVPRAAPGVPPPSPAQRLRLEGREYAKAERCLANAIYFEARSEPVRGQMAVAQVVLNRAFSGFYPNDICGVVYQNAGRHLACQFTFACDGKSKIINERGAWARANRIAKQTLNGQIYVPEVAKSTHYHAIYVHPNWVREMKKMVRYGIHNFYRPIAWGNGAEEPVWGSGALAERKK